jgi:electron transfer flavoprotein beta subunit
MKLLVVVEIGADVRIPPQRDPRSGRVREEWLVRDFEPASARALDIALRSKTAQPGVEVTVVHLGPVGNESWLRSALARGCDRAVRVWDETVATTKVAGKAVVLAAAARAAGFDLVLCGTGGLLDASGQLGVLLAEGLGVPCVTEVVEMAWGARATDAPETDALPTAGAGRVELARALDQGVRERVEGRLPLVAAVSGRVSVGGAGDSSLNPNVPATALLGAQEREIPVWTLADLGVPFDQVRRADRALRFFEPRPVRPRVYPLKVPDPALPAFERVLKLVDGAVQRRAGRIVRKPAEEIVEEIFRTLKDEGWLDHLRLGADGPAPGPRAGGPEGAGP